MELSIEGYNFKEKVVALVEVPDHVYFIKDDTAIFPTHTDYGFVYLSTNEFPKNYLYEKMLESDEMQDAISNLKDLKDTLKQYEITDYSSIPSMITDEIDGIENIDLSKALELVDDYEKNKEDFIKAVDKDFKIEDVFVFPYAIVEVEDTDKISETKKYIKEDIEDIVTVGTRDENLSYDGFQREAEEGETYSGVFSGLFVFIAILSVVTTMNRFVKKERTQIGTLKALGIRKSKITRMYVNYSLFIAIVASILGIVLGNLIIGNFFLEMEMEYYEIPYYDIVTIPLVYGVAVGIVVVITLVTYLSCRKILKEPAAQALRIERPNVKVKENNITTKNAFKNMSLSTKWNIRDIARSKGRSLMALVGIAGCTMLVVTAFGMLDSMKAYTSWEFDVINNFKYKLSLATDYTDNQYNDIISKYGDSSSETLGVEFKHDDEVITKALTVNNTKGLLQTTDHNRKPFEMKNDGLYLTEKMASIYGLNIGDIVEWHIIGSDEWYNSKIAGFNRDPQSQQFNCTKEFYDT